MTEIQWLCSVLLECKLPKDVKDRFIARIGQVEEGLSKRSPQTQAPQMQPLIMPPSSRTPPPDFDPTQIPPQAAKPILRTSPVEIDKTTGRAMVNNGDGTRGPRKF